MSAKNATQDIVAHHFETFHQANYPTLSKDDAFLRFCRERVRQIETSTLRKIKNLPQAQGLRVGG